MNALGFAPFSFRFRGLTNRLLNIYACFQERPDEALHPAQIARTTGLSIAEVTRRLDNTPELFVKLPKRPDGLTRYRLTTAARAQTTEEVKALLKSGERSESLSLYAVVAIVACLFAVVVLMILPWFRFGF